MADIVIYRQIKKGRTFLRVEVTPKSTETRKLLRQFQAGVREFEKNWKATDAYRAARKAKKAKAKKKKTAK
jgi:murein L,D-transpeptidase YafK